MQTAVEDCFNLKPFVPSQNRYFIIVSLGASDQKGTSRTHSLCECLFFFLMMTSDSSVTRQRAGVFGFECLCESVCACLML